MSAHVPCIMTYMIASCGPRCSQAQYYHVCPLTPHIEIHDSIMSAHLTSVLGYTIPVLIDLLPLTPNNQNVPTTDIKSLKILSSPYMEIHDAILWADVFGSIMLLCHPSRPCINMNNTNTSDSVV